MGECNTGLIGVCIYSLCERVEREQKVDSKGKLDVRGVATNRLLYTFVCLPSWTNAVGPLVLLERN